MSIAYQFRQWRGSMKPNIIEKDKVHSRIRFACLTCLRVWGKTGVSPASHGGTDATLLQLFSAFVSTQHGHTRFSTRLPHITPYSATPAVTSHQQKFQNLPPTYVSLATLNHRTLLPTPPTLHTPAAHEPHHCLYIPATPLTDSQRPYPCYN